MQLVEIRRSILVSLGLMLGCGPTTDPAETSGGGEGTGGSDSTASGVSTTDTGQADTSSSATGHADSSSGEPPPVLCEGSTPIMQDGVMGSVPTGWEVCDSGLIHRVEHVECVNPWPEEDSCDVESPVCQTDEDCTERPFGRCGNVLNADNGITGCECRYGCVTDDDCPTDTVCACGAFAGGYPKETQCVPSNCSDDASCDELLCAMGGKGNSSCNNIEHRSACLTTDDECWAPGDCAHLNEPGTVGVCYPQDDERWGCDEDISGVCGRPLLVEGRPRSAAAVARDDWGAECMGDDSTLPVAVRQRITDYWTRAARLEHASVASFARFTLELMSLGAPPSLLVAAQRAGLDEIDHARRCFALASTYRGAPVGPGPLDSTGVTVAPTLEAVMEAVIDEACVGETLAAVEAQAALARATEPAVVETLRVIMADELRHAQLGWQTLAWALRQVDAPARARLLGRLDAAIDRVERERPAAVADLERRRLNRHGVLDSEGRHVAWTDAIAQVLRPCAAMLDRAGYAEPPIA